MSKHVISLCFHTALNFMKVIGQHFANSGQLTIELKSHGDNNTAHNNMAAKSYNRIVRAHKRTYEALWRLFGGKFVKWAEDSSVDINPDIIEAAKSITNEMSDKSSVYAVRDQINKNVEILAGTVDRIGNREIPLFTYWRQYMKLVSLLL